MHLSHRSVLYNQVSSIRKDNVDELMASITMVTSQLCLMNRKEKIV